MRMRAVVVAGVAAGLVLAGCGSPGQSGESAAPVESESASGEVATYFGDCPEGHPARDALAGVTYPGRSSAAHDGVVGTIYNDTTNTIRVMSDSVNDNGSCSLKPGKNTMFAGSMGKRETRYWLSPLEVDNYGEMFWVYLYSEGQEGVTAVGFWDPNSGDPQVFASERKYSTGEACPPGEKPATTGEMEEGFADSLTGDAIGALWVTRLRDDKDVARQGTGWDGWAVNDWARVDLRVYELGKC